MKIVSKFAYYTPGFEEIPPEPSYLVTEGEIPGKLRPGMNVCRDQLWECGQNVPMTPIYNEWLRMGSPVFRG